MLKNFSKTLYSQESYQRLPRVSKMTMFGCVVNSLIRGYHEYKSIWKNSSTDNDLLCEHEVGNAHDTHAVAVRKDIVGKATTVRHIPQKSFNIFDI